MIRIIIYEYDLDVIGPVEKKSPIMPGQLSFAMTTVCVRKKKSERSIAFPGFRNGAMTQWIG